jgi:hypothetical protein
MGTPLFRNDMRVTSHAAELLNDAVADCNTIRSTVDQAVVKLVGEGMVSLSGREYGKAVDRWLDDFKIITDNLHAMAVQLKDTGGSIGKNENNLVQMPTQITNLLSR